ncbi:uncharacterized protein DDB_G0283357 [Episyrphus balteatus]|uniref:uncharacterized protein DDB_G0283357 n=1 Tax=Episyrphus balteatus TaxID=286459 RepID=UPI0024856F9F|nr:uncharacterized protein DDB_G0283357 [Episyrphus balteatus]XP_055858464.1 uncharacterized protein DDB_G0283357 [Episyrphus balteatus]XP_055858466.1 uncharacterized protein DDB_G0283357 [Episyrphus balteatus]
MKEIDTEAPVVWPAWCYSDNITTDVLGQSSRVLRTSSSSPSSPSLSSSSLPEIIPSVLSHKPAAATSDSTADLSSIVAVTKKLRTKRKSNLINSVDDSIIGQNHQIAKRKKEPRNLSLPLVSGQKQQQNLVSSSEIFQGQHNKPEKMLSDRMLLSGYNAIENSKKLCDSSSSAYLFLEKVKNETQMESLKDSELANNNNVNSSNNNSNPSNTNNNNNSVANNNSSGNCSTNNPSSVISNNNSNSNSNTSNNSVKRERLSPGTNGDAQFSLSRSRSATPSSFRGTPPQTTHPNNDLQLHNLSTNLLSQIQNRSSDFSTRNYSDFMRSLAAKYNNNNPNDSGTSRRSTFFENSKISQPIKSSTNSNTNNGSGLKEQASPSESVKSTQNIQNLTTSASSVPPFVQTFLSSLPFSPGVFPPLIDMSSTQALVTLARAAKEAEIKNILMSAQKRTSLSNNTASSSPGPNLTAALQQAAQFASPALLYSAQLQQQQQQTRNRQSSPNQETSANSSGEKHMTASPLDLSSAPPTKRFKAESTSSGGSDKSPDPDNVPGTSGGGAVATPTSSPKVKATDTIVTSEASVTAAVTTSTPVLPLRQCQAQSDEVNAWSVENVCSFVGSIDICSMYVKNFREQCIDGSGLPLLTEDHLINQLGMRLGPALKLKSMLAKKLGGPCPCVSCSSQAQLLAAAQAAAVTVATSSTSAISTPSSGITGQNQNHPQQNQQAQQISARNSTTCTSNISQTTTGTGASSCCGSVPRPNSADSGS